MNMNYDQNNGYSEVLHRTLGLGTEPVAVKLIEAGEEAPKNVIMPYRDYGKHIAACQAFALVRREKKSIYCDKTSEWCWAPLVAFGLCDCEEGTEAFNVLTSIGGNKNSAMAKKLFENFPRMPLGKYQGILLMPLCGCVFEPDVTLVYCDNNSQLRGAVLAVKNATGDIITTRLDAIDSCAYACVTAIKSGEYCVTIPDIGEHERALAGENEVILSVPSGKLCELTEALAALNRSGMGYTNWKRSLEFDFARPEFYDELFRIWNQ